MSEDYNDPGCAGELLVALALSSLVFVLAFLVLLWWLL